MDSYPHLRQVHGHPDAVRVLDALGASPADLDDVMGERDSMQRLARWLLSR